MDYQIIRTRSGKFRARGTVKQNIENLRMPVELRLRAEGDDADTTVYVAARSTSCAVRPPLASAHISQ